MSDFYDVFLKDRKLIEENDFCETWEFAYNGTPAIVRMTKAKAGKKDEVICGSNKLTWVRRLAPYVIFHPGGTTEESVISDASFARRGAICVFVVRGKPTNFRWIDEHEWLRADNPDDARGKIYLMSEERFKTFEPGANAKN